MEVILVYKLAYTLFILLLVPIYWKHYGPSNFFWFSDIALFGTCLAFWLESELLASMMAIGVLLPEIGWNFDFFLRLFTGKRMFGLSDYMFEEDKPKFLRALSLFHVLIPIVMIWQLQEWSYHEEAIYWQTLVAWIVLMVCYNFTDPKENINWVFGPGAKPQRKINPRFYFCILILFFPLFIFLPTHFILRALF